MRRRWEKGENALRTAVRDCSGPTSCSCPRLQKTSCKWENGPSMRRGPPRILTGPHGFPRAFIPGGVPPRKLLFSRVFTHVFARKKYWGYWSELPFSSPTSKFLKSGRWKSNSQTPEVVSPLASSGNWISTSDLWEIEFGNWASDFQRPSFGSCTPSSDFQHPEVASPHSNSGKNSPLYKDYKGHLERA